MEQEIRVMLETMKGKVERLVSDAESEKGTRVRMHDIIFLQIKNLGEDMSQSVKNLDSDIKDVFYGPDRQSGLVISVDRLKQENILLRRLVYGCITTTGGIIIAELLKLVLK